MRIAAIMTVILFSVTGVSYWYYTHSQQKIQDLTANNASLEIAVGTQSETIQTLEQNYALVVEENQRINLEYAAIRRQNSLLVERFAEHDLGFLAQQRPQLIESIINNASQQAARCFEILSGAPLTQEEQNAQTAQQFNGECPWLFDLGVIP